MLTNGWGPDGWLCGVPQYKGRSKHLGRSKHGCVAGQRHMVKGTYNATQSRGFSRRLRFTATTISTAPHIPMCTLVLTLAPR